LNLGVILFSLAVLGRHNLWAKAAKKKSGLVPGACSVIVLEKGKPVARRGRKAKDRPPV
jgi:hypothetical protein